ncbi:Cyanovirin-N [Apiospora arundinis]
MARFLLTLLMSTLMAGLLVFADPTPFDVSCHTWSFNASSAFLTALCDMKIGSVASSLSLNNCYANYQGNLVPASMGGYSNTCYNARLDNYLDASQPKPQAILSADCSPGAGQINRPNQVNVADIVQNNNGILQCLGNQGCYTCWEGCVACSETGGLIPPDVQNCNDCPKKRP